MGGCTSEVDCRKSVINCAKDMTILPDGGSNTITYSWFKMDINISLDQSLQNH